LYRLQRKHGLMLMGGRSAAQIAMTKAKRVTSMGISILPLVSIHCRMRL